MAKVYIMIDNNNYVTAINSDIYITDVSDWVLVDMGEGDKYAHAQSNYLSKQLIDVNGLYNYKYIDGEVVELSDNDKSWFNVDSILGTKIKQIKNMCETAIVSGVDADVLGRGMLHYSLTNTKQDDIKVLMSNIINGATAVLWHDDSRVMHEIYTAEQFTALYNTVFSYIITCKITSDGLEQYATDLANTKDVDKLKAITWETVLPDDIQVQVDEQIALMTGGI